MAGAVLLCLGFLLTAACGESGNPASTSTAATTPPPATPSPSPAPSPTPAPPGSPPERDLFDLARRFRGLSPDTPRLARDAPYAYRAGDSQEFTLLDLKAPSMYTVRATVRAVTDHAYFFVQDGAAFSQSNLDRIASDFESLVYPQVTSAFGQEWAPGTDSDPRMTILHADLRGAVGYFSGSDEYPRAVVPRSNEREALYLESSILNTPGERYNALAAHELQHLVHWYADADEDSWVSEGLSQVAAEMLSGSSIWVSMFLQSPDTQLNFWPLLGNTTIHYGQSELFFTYLLDQYGGRQNASHLLRQRADGIEGVDAYLAGFDTRFDSVFADWVVANYLDEEKGRYSHAGLDVAVPARGAAPGQAGDDTVHQFAADYLELSGPATFSFDGSDTVSVGVPAADGSFWWSGRGDSIDSRLTREFDLSGLSSATLRFSAWFDAERGWDYAYVAASADGGKTWKALPGARTTDEDPVGAAYGPGYTGSSGGWVAEEVDLSEFAGKKVQLRFEYVTDDATNLTGFAVDGIQVPELGFRDGADADNGWHAEGFQRIAAPLPQRFIVQVIDRSGGPAQVTRIELDSANRAQVRLPGGATIVMAAATDGTAEQASYRWSVSAP